MERDIAIARLRKHETDFWRTASIFVRLDSPQRSQREVFDPARVFRTVCGSRR